MTFRVVPWRDQAEWRQVRAWFYESSADSDDRELALSRVAAWHVHGRVPHAVVATATLTAGLLKADVLPELDVRLLLSAAIVRFVNGLLDPAQQSTHAISLTQLARNTGLPEYYVELRHAATHEELPTLDALRDAAEGALDWLYANYWSLDEVAEKSDLEGQQSSLQVLLDRWYHLRRHDPDKVLTAGDHDQNVRESLAVLKEIERVTAHDSLGGQCCDRIVKDPHRSLWLAPLSILAQRPGFARQFVLAALSLSQSDTTATYILDQSLLGEASSDPTRSISSTTLDHLDSISLTLMADHPDDFDHRDFLRALALAKDDRSRRLIERIAQDTDVDVSMPANWRHITIQQRPMTEQEPPIEIAQDGVWQRLRPTYPRPIGFLDK